MILINHSYIIMHYKCWYVQKWWSKGVKTGVIWINTFVFEQNDRYFVDDTFAYIINDNWCILLQL